MSEYLGSSFPSLLRVPPLYGSAKAFGTVLAASFSFAANFTGPVVRVLDGDTLEVLHNQRPERIRLQSIELPREGPSLRQAGQAGYVRAGFWERRHASDARLRQV